MRFATRKSRESVTREALRHVGQRVGKGRALPVPRDSRTRNRPRRPPRPRTASTPADRSRGWAFVAAWRSDGLRDRTSTRDRGRRCAGVRIVPRRWCIKSSRDAGRYCGMPATRRPRRAAPRSIGSRCARPATRRAHRSPRPVPRRSTSDTRIRRARARNARGRSTRWTAGPGARASAVPWARRRQCYPSSPCAQRSWSGDGGEA